MPLLSRIEHVEAVRNLPFGKRIAYILISGFSIVLVFLLLVVLAISTANIAFSILIGEATSIDDALLLAMPVATAFMVSIGFSGNPVAESVAPGDTLQRTIKRAARSGFINGLISGFVFGLVWSMAIRIGALYIQLNTRFHSEVYLSEILLYCVMMALIIAPTFAVFRAFTSSVGHITLYVVSSGDEREKVI
jgi:hypothetical protein